MRIRGVLGVTGLLVAGAIASPALAENKAERRGVFMADHGLCEGDECRWCTFAAPVRRAADHNQRLLRGGAPVAEVEPNDSPAQAQVLDVGTNPGQPNNLLVDAAFNSSGEDDWFQVTLNAGDTMIVYADGGVNGDTQIRLEFSDGSFLQFAEDESGVSNIFPPDTPFPVAPVSGTFNALLYFPVPITGTYNFRLTEFSDNTYPYQLNIGIFRSLTESSPGRIQKFFIDFDGETITPSQIWGFGNSSPSFQPGFATFLPNWGVDPSRESDLIDGILDVVVENLEDVRALNPNFQYELLNSRDDPDTFGIDPDVSRVIVGGSIASSGINTIGIAEFIDPGNYSLDDTAIVLLDLLSDPSFFNPSNYGPGFTVEDWIELVVGNIVTHEFGHYIGHIHTDTFNSTPAIMDAGGNLDFTIGAVGPDGLYGTADDGDSDFVADEFQGGFFLTGTEFVDFATAFNLSGAASGCPGDADGDGDTTTADITFIVSNLGAGSPGAQGTPGDVDGNGLTTTADITLAVSNLGCTTP
ncbi:MAG: hypothetical protein AAGD00_03805 [Planctomycetota bacterium]